MTFWYVGNTWINPEQIVAATERDGQLLLTLTDAAARGELAFAGAEAAAVRGRLLRATAPPPGVLPALELAAALAVLLDAVDGTAEDVVRARAAARAALDHWAVGVTAPATPSPDAEKRPS